MTMEQVRLFPLQHKDVLQIGIAFKFNAELKSHLKKLEIITQYLLT